MKGTCEKCGQERHVGLFRTESQTFKALCGPCKVKLTMTPERTKRLAEELSELTGTSVTIEPKTSDK
jgi:hypothetical protein